MTARNAKRARNARRVDPSVGMFGELVPHSGWSRYVAPGRPIPEGLSSWRTHDGLYAVSGCHVAPLPGTDGEVGPQWLVSVSLLNVRDPASRVHGRPDDEHVARVVAGFAMPAFDEDNHHPGVARHLWCPHDEAARLACECKVTETVVVEPDGYTWTTDSEGECRGCAYEQLFGPAHPCPLHHPVVS